MRAERGETRQSSAAGTEPSSSRRDERPTDRQTGRRSVRSGQYFITRSLAARPSAWCALPLKVTRRAAQPLQRSGFDVTAARQQQRHPTSSERSIVGRHGDYEDGLQRPADTERNRHDGPRSRVSCRPFDHCSHGRFEGESVIVGFFIYDLDLFPE